PFLLHLGAKMFKKDIIWHLRIRYLKDLRFLTSYLYEMRLNKKDSHLLQHEF
ncbi:7769_t:CDS:1, partial [Cetraspora pellucida]